MPTSRGIEVIALVEGETEKEFVQFLIAPIFRSRNVILKPVLFGKKGGGIPNWASGQRDVLRYLKQGDWVTTLVDFYGLPADWPGRREAGSLSWDKRGGFVEAALCEWSINQDIRNFRSERFIPCVQVHEFESLLYADPTTTAKFLSVAANSARADFIESKINGIVASVGGNVEAINDSFDTAPSRRLKELVPSYEKRAWGYQIAGDIGISKLRESCRWFHRWLERLESLGGW